jgi:SAM-dependent methyltransferase
VLEVGCGTGTITQFLTERELVVGVDVVPQYVEACRARFNGVPNLRFLLQDLTAPIALDLAPFDSAVSVNVFEHIPDDLAALEAVNRLLAPGGTITLLVPAHRLLMSPFDRSIGHYRRYTRPELQAKLTTAGFKVERMRRSNPVGAAGWLVNNVLLRRRRLGAVGLYDRMVPLLSRIDALIEPPFGLSLVAVGRKPARSS